MIFFYMLYLKKTYQKKYKKKKIKAKFTDDPNIFVFH